MRVVQRKTVHRKYVYLLGSILGFRLFLLGQGQVAGSRVFGVLHRLEHGPSAHILEGKCPLPYTWRTFFLW